MSLPYVLASCFYFERLGKQASKVAGRQVIKQLPFKAAGCQQEGGLSLKALPYRFII